MLDMQIESGLLERSGKSVNHFPAVFPPSDSDMVNQIFKDPYLFDFTSNTFGRYFIFISQFLNRKTLAA